MNIGADGMKTGFIKEAGYGLVGSAVQNGLRLIVVVNGLKSGEGTRRRRRRSCSNGVSTISNRGFCSTKARSSPTPRPTAADQSYVPLMAQNEVRLMMPRGVRERIIARVVYSVRSRRRFRRGSGSAR